MRILDVWLDGYDTPVGQLTAHDNGNVHFRYAADFLGRGTPISLSLPLSALEIGDAVTRAFFENLLPENDQMRRVMEREGLDRADIVGILAHIGADCAGALSCLPAGSPPIKVPGDLSSDYQPLSDSEVARIAHSLAERGGLPEDITDPSPVAGVQSKLAVTLLPDGRFALPRNDRKVPTTHILKVPRYDRKEEAKQEDAASRLAEACGFVVSDSRHVVIDGVDALLIRRFDRSIAGGRIYRIHQEDFAQALGLPAGLKYERYGTPGRQFDAAAARRILLALDRPAQAIETFLLATLFNLAVGNNDNHAKNHAILYGPDGTRSFAPLYDLLPVRLDGGFTDQLAFNLGSATHFDAMTAADMSTFLEVFGFTRSRALRFIERSVRPMLETIEARAPMLRDIGLRRFDDLLGRELARLSGLLDLGLALRQRDLIAPQAGGWVIS